MEYFNSWYDYIMLVLITLVFVGAVPYVIRGKINKPYRITFGSDSSGSTSAVIAVILCIVMFISVCTVPFYGVGTPDNSSIQYAWSDGLSSKINEYEIDVYNGNIFYYINTMYFRTKPHIVHREIVDYTYEPVYEPDDEIVSLDEAAKYTYEPSASETWEGPEFYADNNGAGLFMGDLKFILFLILVIAISMNLISHIFRFNTGWNIIGIVSGVMMLFSLALFGQIFKNYIPYVYEFVQEYTIHSYLVNESRLLWGFYAMCGISLIILVTSAMEIYNNE